MLSGDEATKEGPQKDFSERAKNNNNGGEIMLLKRQEEGISKGRLEKRLLKEMVLLLKGTQKEMPMLELMITMRTEVMKILRKLQVRNLVQEMSPRKMMRKTIKEQHPRMFPEKESL